MVFKTSADKGMAYGVVWPLWGMPSGYLWEV